MALDKTRLADSIKQKLEDSADVKFNSSDGDDADTAIDLIAEAIVEEFDQNGEVNGQTDDGTKTFSGKFID